MRRILLVDDQEGYGALLQRVMRGFEVVQELSAAAALQRAYGWQPDLYLLDLRLPDIFGQELAGLIRRDPVIGGRPIIFISALIQCGDEPGVLDGCPAFGKPFRIETLKRCILEELRALEPAEIGPSESWLQAG